MWKMILKKIFLSWWIIKFLKKTVKNVIKHRDFKFPTAEARRNYLVSEPNYRAKIFFSWKFMSNKDSNTHK